MQINDEQSFLEYIEKHKGILKRITKMYAYNNEDRQDLQQDIIVQLWKSYNTFRGESKFSTWMYRVGVNTAITYLKKEKRSIQFQYKENFPELVFEEYKNEKDNQLQIFYRAVQELNQIEKAIIFYFMEGMTHKETALQLGISDINVRVRLNRTKDKLQKIIKKHGYEF
ncbi:MULTISPECIES: sigma-70 family RNA polymerase sigma factor [unclassified Flavobacterium]|uniref:RNA polymerase sigma factor n=1 Tax=unclassified Flavobacterium TaxID=196869 RepID=UPI00086B0058|nr:MULTISPECIES: sigma-70 family RNA polymerase sigma factor [unclassified Flavobacterium]MBN9285549.1 sigma-70 family RNA polymerase sigma factor [Flavobacterium sp.]ODS81470.1 MAG: RNA polymerase subunit sigma-70 [Chryseobacterium sp. SCN 40-13]OJV71092.1 MAG: RNA polymerase subunit sigma-70 [Flavobacterium sp. 40-81]